MVQYDLDVLRKDVIEILIEEPGAMLRCHEDARIISKGLRERGYEGFAVRDGMVKYNPHEALDYLINHMDSTHYQQFAERRESGYNPAWEFQGDDRAQYFAEFLERIPDGLQNSRWHFHSWLEGNGLIIDYNTALNVGAPSENLLIVEQKTNLDGFGEYHRRGFGIGDLVFIWKRSPVLFPLDIIVIRLGQHTIEPFRL